MVIVSESEQTAPTGKDVIYCALDDCANTAYCLIESPYLDTPSAVCAECIEVMAVMNSDNEEWLEAQLIQACPFTGSGWRCQECGKQWDSFHLHNGVCTFCRKETLY